MTTTVRIKAEYIHPGKVAAINAVDKKSKKATLVTKLTENGQEVVISVWDNQDVQIREADA